MGAPQPRPRLAPSGTAARSPAEYPSSPEMPAAAEPPQQPAFAVGAGAQHAEPVTAISA